MAAPRTWDEISDPALRQFDYTEVLARVARHGDLLADLDADVPGEDRLTTYRSMRDSAKTPEPVPRPSAVSDVAGRAAPWSATTTASSSGRHAGGCTTTSDSNATACWCVGGAQDLPDTTAVNHLAVHTEDHPLEYATFEGAIPKGEYGGGKVIIWDSGTYEAEKFNDHEVIVDLYGQRITGRYALIQTNGDQWLAHRMKEQPTPHLQDYAPMLATLGSVDKLTGAQYAFEGKFDGYRLLVEVDHGRLRLQSRSGRDVTAEYPQLHALAADLADHDVILDGEVVALDADGVPNFGEMQNRVRATRIEFWAFDILRLDGRSLLRAKYRDRRKVLETFAAGTDLIVPALIDGDGPAALEYSRKKKWEGVVAKKWDATYQPGRRSSAWIKDKNWNTQEIVIGGWREGNGGRSSGIGALLMGIPGEGGLRFVGRVGTGFSDKELSRLKAILAPLHTDESPFDPPLPRLETGRRLRATGVGRRGALRRVDVGRPAASPELARTSAGQGTR